ncbi:MAG: alpha/beta hydrolase, partial [Burkholderiaceae bacterium]
LQSNPRENVFHIGFTACDQYSKAFEALVLVNRTQAAILFIVGRQDQMTPPKAAQALINAAPQASVVTVDAGHSIMTEAPDATLLALHKFLSAPR